MSEVRLSECPICLLDGPDNEPCPCRDERNSQLTPEQREIRSLRKRLAEASAAVKVQALTLAHATHALEQSRQDVAASEQRAERAEKELVDEVAKADAAVWRSDQLQRELDQRAQVARVERQLRLRAERELERWRLRLRDRARRRKEETEGPVGGVDWLASRARAQEARGRSHAGRRGIWPPFPVNVMAQLSERVRLPGDDRPEDIAEHHVCPGCYAVDGPCLPGCIDAEIAADRERDREGPAWEQDDAEVDAELRAMGADPDAVAARGLAFVQMVKRVGPPPTSMLAMGKPPGDKR